MIRQQLMRPGDWQISFRTDVPPSIIRSIGTLNHLVVLPTRTDLRGLDDAGILATALYTGVIVKRSGRGMSGYDPSWWLGTPEGRGSKVDVADSGGLSLGLTNWLLEILGSGFNGITIGSTDDTGLTSRYGRYQYMTPREAIDDVCLRTGGEWRINPDFTIDAGPADFLFETADPDVVITRAPAGREGDRVGVDIRDFDLEVDASKLANECTVINDGETLDTASQVLTHLGPSGGIPHLEFFAGSPAIADLSGAADYVLASQGQEQRKVTLTTSTYALPATLRVGDYVHIFDMEDGIGDPAHQLWWRGELITPELVRCLAYQWPVEAGMGVYVRRSGSPATYIDITDYVQPETSPATWEVGGLQGWANAGGSTVRLGENGAIAARAADTRGVIARTLATASSWSNATTTPSDITATTGDAPSLTLALDPQRLYRAVLRAPMASTVGTDAVVLSLVEDSVPLRTNALPFGDQTGTVSMRFECLFTPASATPATFKMQGRRGGASSGTLSITASATHVIEFYIEDVGPA